METFFVDAHAHLISPWFPETEIPKVIQRAKEHGVQYMNTCSSEPDTYHEALQHATKYQEIFLSIGLQPTIASENTLKQMQAFIHEHKPMISALGEVGLDYYWVKEEAKREEQRRVFQEIIAFANQERLSLVIHSRKAELESVEMLVRLADVPVYLHSFEGNLAVITSALDAGFYIGVVTSVVSRKNRKKVAQRTPLEHMLLETDAPFLPVNPEIKPNEPMYIPEAARMVAQIHETSIEEVARLTTKNAKTIYKRL